MISSIATPRTAVLALGLALLAGCAPTVTRIAPEQVIDLSGHWNDSDSRVVAQALIEQSFDSGWLSSHIQRSGGNVPTVIVGSVRNRSMEHIPVATFVRDLERAYVNSNQVRVVAGGGERDELRDERLDQQQHAAEASRSALSVEQGADYMLQGEIQSIEDQEGRRRVVFYQVDVSLVDVESNSRVWIGQHKIKKYIENPRVRF